MHAVILPFCVAIGCILLRAPPQLLALGAQASFLFDCNKDKELSARELRFPFGSSICDDCFFEGPLMGFSLCRLGRGIRNAASLKLVSRFCFDFITLANLSIGNFLDFPCLGAELVLSNDSATMYFLLGVVVSDTTFPNTLLDGPAFLLSIDDLL